MNIFHVFSRFRESKICQKKERKGEKREGKSNKIEKNEYKYIREKEQEKSTKEWRKEKGKKTFLSHSYVYQKK